MSIICKYYRTSETECGVCYPCVTTQLRAELAASEALVDALNTQRGVDAVASLRAVEEAREEVRETCARIVEAGPDWVFSAAAIRATPLTATPLRERIAELEADLARVVNSWGPGNIDRAEKAEAERDALKAELAESQRQATLAQELREERNNAMQESASLRKQANERMDGLVEVARALGLTRAIMRIPEIVEAASSLKAQVERLTAALRNLVTWGRWARKRAGVAMDTPHSGALTAAEDLLAEEKP